MSTHANTKEKYTYKRIEIEQLLASEYPSIAIKSLSLIKKGIINTSIRIVTQNGVSYLLRIYRSAGRTKKDIERELEFCSQLQREGLPVATVIANESGKKITMLRTSAGAYFAVLFSFLSGDHIKSSNHRLIPSVAHAHATMHTTALNSYSKTKRGTATIAPIINWLEAEYEAAQKKIKNNPELQHKCAELYNEIISLSKRHAKDIKTLPFGLCHLDYDSDNILETKGKVTGIVDFDDMQNVPFSLDLAFSLWWWCFHNQKRNFVFSEYLKQYESQRRLTKQEKSIMLFFLRIRNFILFNLLFINLPKIANVSSVKKALRFDKWIISKLA